MTIFRLGVGMHRLTNVLVRTTVAVLTAWSGIFAQGYLVRDTLWVKAIFYDFRSDGSNPNFQAGSRGKKPGMIQDTLSIDRKPIFKADLCFNSRLDEWFRPSGSNSSVTFGYNSSRRRWEWTGLVRSVIDSTGWQGPRWKDRPEDSMTNIVFYDSLPFALADSESGAYNFIRNNNLLDHQQFFWLDGRGFGNELSKYTHNYSFTMEMHQHSIYRGGEFFEFQGDDDAWAFINGKLVADLGGTQAEGRVRLTLDSLAALRLGLRIGQPYYFDFFYTERLAFQSNCVIKTNMFTPPRLASLIVTTSPSVPDPFVPIGQIDTTLLPGQKLPLYAYVFDGGNTFRPDYSSTVRWEFFNAEGVKILPDAIGRSIDFTMPQVFGCVTIRQTYIDNQNPSINLSSVSTICNAGSTGNAIPVTAIVRDTNINGQFDRIDLIFPDSVSLIQNLPAARDLLQSATFTTSNGEVIRIDPIALVRYNDTTIHLILRESGTETGWYSGLIQLRNNPLTTNGNPAIIVRVVDSVGPVVEKALLYSGNAGSPDTLKLLFSEPVDCQKLQSSKLLSSFLYADSGMVNDAALTNASFTGGCSAPFISEVRITIPRGSIEIIPGQDSIGFVARSPSVIDRSGMRPGARVHLVPIEAGRNNPIELFVHPNPIRVGVPIDQRIRNAYTAVVRNETHGALVSIKSDIPLRQVDVKGFGPAYGTADIYDAVSNLVATNLPVIKTSTPGIYGVLWNVQNRFGRYVGNGTYLMIVKTTTVTGQATSRRTKLGVQR